MFTTTFSVSGSCIANGITVCCTKDHCKNQISPDGCYCDNLCRQHGDCCDDIDQLCPTGSILIIYICECNISEICK